MHILIVEDEDLIAEDLKVALEELGHTVSGIAATAPTAFQAVVQTDADLAIVDTRLGGESSEKVVQACKGRGLPVIISSGHHRSVLPDFALGPPLLAKPFGRHDIERAINELLKTAPDA